MRPIFQDVFYRDNSFCQMNPELRFAEHKKARDLSQNLALVGGAWTCQLQLCPTLRIYINIYITYIHTVSNLFMPSYGSPIS